MQQCFLTSDHVNAWRQTIRHSWEREGGASGHSFGLSFWLYLIRREGASVATVLKSNTNDSVISAPGEGWSSKLTVHKIWQISSLPAQHVIDSLFIQTTKCFQDSIYNRQYDLMHHIAKTGHLLGFSFYWGPWSLRTWRSSTKVKISVSLVFCFTSKSD